MSTPNPNTLISLSQFDPAKYGWTIGGGVDDLLSPYERARRREAKRAAKSKEKHKLAEEATLFGEKGEGAAPRETPATDSAMSDGNELSHSNDNTEQKPKSTAGKILGHILNMDLYHLGEVGSERRQPLSFELIDENEPQDMNHHWDPKTFVTKIQIRFPLNDIGDLDDSSVEYDHDGCNNNNASATIDMNGDDQQELKRRRVNKSLTSENETRIVKVKSTERNVLAQHYFEEEIRWNFADPSMPTPAEYAMNIACEFGLSWGASLELQENIQKQLQAYVKANVFLPSVTLRDAAGKKRDVSVLYAQAERERAQAQHIIQDTPSASNRSGSATGKKSTFDVVAFDPESDHMYLTEVKRRLKSASVAKNISVLKNKSYSEQTVQRGIPKIQLVENEICHVCRGSKPILVRFSCNLLSHNFCEFHCKQRLGIDINFVNLNNCEIHEVATDADLSESGTDRPESNHNQTSGQSDAGLALSTATDSSNIPGTASPLSSTENIKCGAGNIFESVPQIPAVASESIERDSLKCISYYNTICPICSLVCECNKCTRRLEKIAKELKLRCIDLTDRNPNYDKDPISCVKLDVWGLAVGPNECGSRESFSSTKRRRSSDVNAEKFQTKPKDVHKTQLPQKERSLKELMTGITLTTVPKINVNIIPHEVSHGWSSSSDNVADESQIKGDGNIDYCMKCLAAGNLICCDKCPRSYHKECAVSESDKSTPTTETSEHWICPNCVRYKEKDIDMSDSSLVVSEESYTEDMKKAFVNILSEENSDDKKIIVLAKIYAMVISLMNYDFGYIFREPVDLPDYTKIIEKPMDLGTIQSKLFDGKYADLVLAKNSSDASSINGLDYAISLVLIDVEQIWQNCYVYNLEGSSVYRMADVQRSQCNRIRQRSIESDLPIAVKNFVKKFVDDAEAKRKQISTASTLIPYASRLPKFVKIAANEVLTPKPGSPVIERKSATTQAASRSVIVIDPDSNTIVRYYTTQRFAMQACYKLLKNGHDSGLSPHTDHFWRKMIKAASLDPTITVFGYRWLLQDEVLDRMVIFPGFIDKLEKPSSKELKKSITLRQNLLVLKKDAISGAILERFSSIEDAYRDWISTKNISISKSGVYSSENKDLVLFEKDFLQGTHHIDGIRWKLEILKTPHNNLKDKVSRSSRTASSVDKQRPSSVDKQRLKEITRKEKKDQRQAEFIASIPPPLHDHCNAYIRHGKNYCKRKVVPDGNYCLIHMKQLLQGNGLATGVMPMSKIKGTLPPDRKRHGKQAGHDKSSSVNVNLKPNILKTILTKGHQTNEFPKESNGKDVLNSLNMSEAKAIPIVSGNLQVSVENITTQAASLVATHASGTTVSHLHSSLSPAAMVSKSEDQVNVNFNQRCDYTPVLQTTSRLETTSVTQSFPYNATTLPGADVKMSSSNHTKRSNITPVVESNMNISMVEDKAKVQSNHSSGSESMKDSVVTPIFNTVQNDVPECSSTDPKSILNGVKNQSTDSVT